MSTAPHPKKRRLGEILMDAGVLSELQLRSALAEQRKWGGKLGRTLVEMGFVDEESMVLALSRQMQIPAVDLEKVNVTEELLGLLKVDVAERYGVFPVAGDRKSKTLQLAASDPTNMDALQELAFTTGLRIQPAVASERAIERAIRKHYYGEVVTSTPTASPVEMGLQELDFDGETLQTSGSVVGAVRQQPMHTAPASLRSAPSTPTPSATPVLPPSATHAPHESTRELTDKVAALTSQVAELEKLVGGQVRAMRGILELLIEKRMLTREEYLAKMRAAAPPAAPKK